MTDANVLEMIFDESKEHTKRLTILFDSICYVMINENNTMDIGLFYNGAMNEYHNVIELNFA